METTWALSGVLFDGHGDWFLLGAIVMVLAGVPHALAGGSFIFLGTVIVLLFAVVFGYYTITGSGINKHPNDGQDGAPGSSGPSEASGMGRSSGDTSEDHGVGDTFSTRGTG